jgi:protein-S-isoprenylcysteine O-methyltransferase Ste14
MALNQRLGQTLYGSVFVILLPALLIAWAWRLDQSGMTFWPIPWQPWVGMALLLAGLALMLVAMRALWMTGKGLPMNAYPPAHYVANSIYSVFSHPIYLGFIGVVGGISIAVNSPAGLWVVTPIMALAVTALVVGYEGPRLRERFGDGIHSPLLGLPADHPDKASWVRRLAATVVALGPWAILYSLFSMMPVPEGARELRLAWEYRIPIVNWTIWLYSAAYPLAVMGPLWLRTHRELRRYVISAWLATGLGFSWMMFFPGRAALLPLSGNGLDAELSAVNRLLDAEWLALPSFHVIWVIFAAYCLCHRFRILTPAWLFIATAIGVSCILTGSHAVVDIVGGVLVGLLCWHHAAVWRGLVHYAEVLGNSWTAIHYGPIRVISHALWSGIAATVGILLAIWLVGPEFIGEIAWVFSIALLSAGAWGYWLEGGTRLSRPFGYYGFLFGAILGLSVLAFCDLSAAHDVMAAFACAAPPAQAIGRLRCLVQGCCHGKPVLKAPGLCIINPKSRVTALGGLQGVPIHPTQLYSIIGNLLIFACLWRLWHCGATTTFIGGLYLVFSSLARFVEECYRGEPQTFRIFDLAIYQWLAVILFLAGIMVSMVDGIVVQMARSMTLSGVLIAVVAGLLAAFLMSVDFPGSQRRFSRLTVGDA